MKRRCKYYSKYIKGGTGGKTQRKLKRITSGFWKLVSLTVFQLSSFLLFVTFWYIWETNFVWHEAVILLIFQFLHYRLRFIAKKDAQLAIWKNKPDGHDTNSGLACRARPKGTWRRGRQGGRGGEKKEKNSFPPLPLPYFYTSTSPLESIFDSPQLSVNRKSISIAQQNTPALQANTAPVGVHWFFDCCFVLNRHLRSLVTYRTLYLPLGVCLYFEVNSTLTAYPHRTLHPRPHNRNSFCQLLIFQLLLGDVRGTQRLFSVNICSEKQILPRICYYLRTAKNF